MSLAAGSRLGPYEILAPIGAGGMGEVYRARDSRLDRIVAIKVSNDRFSERFAGEARAIAALNHPHICHLYDVGSNYLVMEYIDGHVLKGPLPLDQTLKYGVQICDALDAAHKKGIVHRDLKPANVLVTKSGVKLLDFGLAKRQLSAGASASDVTITQDHAIIGTLQYMSPEQLQGKPADLRSDIFALGCVLHEIATGKPAFTGSDAASLIAAIMTADPPSMSSLNPVTPPAVDRVVKKCLAKDPEARWQSARDLGDELNWIASPGSVTTSNPKAPERMFWRWAASSLALLALAGGGIWAWHARSPMPTPVRFEQLTLRDGLVTRALFQRDGSGFTYTAKWDGGAQHTYAGRLGEREHRELPLADYATVTAVSPTGELAIRIPPGDNPAASAQLLARVPSSGGPHREITENVVAADWTPDGSSLVVARRLDSFFRIEWPVGHKLYEGTDLQPYSVRVSRDGKRLGVEALRLGTSFNGEVGVFDQSGHYTALHKSPTGSPMRPGPLCWSPSGSELWFGSLESRDSGVVYAANLKGQVRQLIGLPGYVKIEDVRSDGGVLVTLGSARSDIKVQDPTGRHDLPWFGFSKFPELTRDGRTMIFVEEASQRFGRAIYRRSLDGSPAVKLSDGFPIALSPSGRYLIAWRPEADPAYIVVPSGAGEEKPMRVPGYEFGPGAPMAWLPDEKNIVARAHEPGHSSSRLVVYNTETGSVRAITSELHLDSIVKIPVVPDGSAVFAKADGNWFRFPLGGGTGNPVKGLEPGEMILQSASDGRYVFVARVQPSGDFRLWRLDPQSGNRTIVTDLPDVGPSLNAGFDPAVTADGSTIVYPSVTLRSSLYLLTGIR